MAGHGHSARPECDWSVDDALLAQAITELWPVVNRASNIRSSHTAKLLLPVLRSCKYPNTEARDQAAGLLLLDGYEYEAKAILDSTAPEVPIITERQKYFKWREPDRPLSEFFDWMVDDDRMVSVQIPSLDADQSSFDPRTMQGNR
ncbi:hypothetical protein Neosp_015120 [[Neocosmospora] mangrovei]